ncbi:MULTISPECIES: AraC family transcriptional regulator [unclassified Mycolicibacterium]|uniref:AraC family transcriptional regulator n=1 Tax=unclassified Mycolicibacterium TaxID=2636767 RepID=UPI002EDA55DD
MAASEVLDQLLAVANHSVSDDCAETSDPDVAADLLTRAYAPHQLRANVPAHFGFELRMTATERLRIGRTRIVGDVTIDVPPTSSFYVFCYAPTGSVRATSGRNSVQVSPTAGSVMTPTEPWRFDRWTDDSALLAMRVDRADLEEDLAAILGRPIGTPIRFHPEMDLTDRWGRDFLRTLQIVRNEISDPDGLTRHPALASRFEQLVRSSLLVSQTHNYSDALRQPGETPVPKAIRDVVAVIEADPLAIATAADLARIACMSLRTLEQGFAQFIGISPMSFVRRTRLSKVRADLLRSDPDAVTVFSVARRWGFNHMGRFAAYYEQQYAELPSQTLRRSR